MGTATKKQFRVLALAVLLCILLAGCSDSAAPSPAASGSTGTKKAYVPHGEVEWTYQYSSDAALAEKVEENGFLILKETVELDAEGRAEQIVTEAAIWADTLYNAESGSSGRAPDSLQAEAALQAMENGLFAPASNTIEIFADNSDILSVTFTYQYSYVEKTAEPDTAETETDGEEEPAATAQAILDKATVASSNNGQTVSVTYTRQADGTMAAQNGGSDAKSQIERILEFATSPSEPLRETISSEETTELILEMGNNAWEDVQELVQEDGYTFEVLPERTELYEAGTQHIRALDHIWEVYRYATRDELYLREFNRQPDAEGVSFYADLYDSIEDSTGKTPTNTFTIQRAIGAEHNGTVAAVYITYEYGVTANDRAQYTIRAVGINGVPTDQVDALLYANSFADLLALYRAYESVTLGYDEFAIEYDTLARCDKSDAWDGGKTTAADEEAGVSAADEGDDDLDDLDAMMGVDTDASTPQGGTGTGDTDNTEDEKEEKEPEVLRSTDPSKFYYPYASTYRGNRAIMNGIWAVLTGKARPSDEEIGEYVLQEIDAAYASLDAADTLAIEVFEGG